MSLDAIAALITAAVALVLAASFGQQFLHRHRPYAAWWAIAFLATALAALLQFQGFLAGSFTTGTYRVYVILAASVPALMGSGSMFLLWARWAWYYTGICLAFIAMTVYGALSVSLSGSGLANVLKASQEVTHLMPSGLVITGFAVLGSLGGLALVLGALWSWWRTRLIYNLGIAAGGIIFSLADTLAAYGIPGLFYGAEIVGVVLLYWAVQKSRQPSPAASNAQQPTAS